MLLEGNYFAAKNIGERKHNVEQHCWMFLNKVKRVDRALAASPRITVLPLASNGGLLHMFADWPASGHASWTLAEAQVHARVSTPCYEGATRQECLFCYGGETYVEERCCSGGDDLQLVALVPGNT